MSIAKGDDTSTTAVNTAIKKANTDAAKDAAEADANEIVNASLKVDGTGIEVKPTSGLKFVSNKEFVSVYTITGDAAAFTLKFVGEAKEGSANVTVTASAKDTEKYKVTSEITVGDDDAVTVASGVQKTISKIDKT